MKNRLSAYHRGTYDALHELILSAVARKPDASMESIARELGVSLSTVQRHLRRARTGK